MKKVKTFTLDLGNGEQDLIATDMEAIKHELEALDLNDYGIEQCVEVTIRIEKKYSQEQLENLTDYTG